MSVLERRFDNAGSAAAAVSAAAAGSASAVISEIAGTDARSSASRRIRLGLTGLAAVFLLVLVTAAGLRPTASQSPADSQADPLAVLGVAPGAGSASTEVAKAPRLSNRPSRT